MILPANYLEGVLASITLALKRGMLCPFTVRDNRYIAVAQVDGHENQFVCISVTRKGALHAFGVATVSPQLLVFTFDQIDPTGPIVPVKPGAGLVTCAMLVEMTLAAFEDVHPTLGGHDDGDALIDLTRIVVGSALVAELLDSDEFYAELMKSGRARRASWGWRLVMHEHRHAEQLRRSCRPNDRPTIETYAVFLVSEWAIQMHNLSRARTA